MTSNEKKKERAIVNQIYNKKITEGKQKNDFKENIKLLPQYQKTERRRPTNCYKIYIQTNN